VIMLRILTADKVNGVGTIEMDEKDLRNLIESVRQYGGEATKNPPRKSSI
jgi:hypothetical protein